MSITVRVTRLGERGDGVAVTPEGEVFVPFALPSEEVDVEPGGERRALHAVLTQSLDRVAPICPLFTRCGGCALQHLRLDALLAWKRGLVETALARRGIAAEVAPCRDAHGAGRRRVVFHVRRVDGVVRAGFMAARSHDLVPVEKCPVLSPGLVRAPKAAEAIGQTLIGRGKLLDIQVTSTGAGLDVDVRGLGEAGRALRETLAALADGLDLARLSLHGDIVVERRKPFLRIGRAMVAPPPGGFLQATRIGEETLAELVAEGLAGAPEVLDLFAGIGPFALRLAQSASVRAIDRDAAALAALQAGWRTTPGLKPLATETRDLFRRPPAPAELDGHAVVFDPPRAGAEAVARALAASHVETVIAVSCSPGTFARDAAILVAGGFSLQRVTPVDQFRYAAHVELVAVFRR